MVQGRLSEEHSRIYQQHYASNLWIQAMRTFPTERAVIVNSLLEPGAIFRTGFYADVLAPQGLVDSLHTGIKAFTREAGGVGGLAFVLSARGLEQAERALPRLQRLAAHFSRALDATMEMGRLAGGGQQLAAILNVMPNAALLLDRKGGIVLANLAAESLLSAGDGLSFDRNGRLRLAAVVPAERAALTRALALTLDVAAGTGAELSEPVRVTRPSGAAPLLVIPVPLPPPAFALWNLSDNARVLVLIVDPSSRPGSAGAILRKSFGLTAAEARVALLVGQGMSGPQAASALGIADATVKTHLGRCFAKLGVNSQVMLARLISALPVDVSTSTF
jgi:DNA-binding CsgD family transcriptional regulator